MSTKSPCLPIISLSANYVANKWSGKQLDHFLSFCFEGGMFGAGKIWRECQQPHWHFRRKKHHQHRPHTMSQPKLRIVCIWHWSKPSKSFHRWTNSFPTWYVRIHWLLFHPTYRCDRSAKLFLRSCAVPATHPKAPRYIVYNSKLREHPTQIPVSRLLAILTQRRKTFHKELKQILGPLMCATSRVPFISELKKTFAFLSRGLEDIYVHPFEWMLSEWCGTQEK